MTRMSIDEAQRRISAFLATDMVAALRGVDAPSPPLSDAPSRQALETLCRAEVTFSHVPGTSDCVYQVGAFGETLVMSLQLNVRRFVALYQVPSGGPVDSQTLAPHFERWAIGAGHAGWMTGWRDGLDPWRREHRVVETYCYASLPAGFLDDPLEQLYWRTDIVQMTRAFMLEARRLGIRLSPP